jgi:hypothetical protein
LGESQGFEPYTKVGVIVPVNGTLDIKQMQRRWTNELSKDVVKPKPTIGFMSQYDL